ncbi:methyltransferase [Phenylobacterium sp.]|jgi:predicted methyltransferase|uniref:class I SAM-dependent methyltransferase n=1 Tax=Phenylobacterium sp. TaxID=1871053 RepID=UPI002F9395A0
MNSKLILAAVAALALSACASTGGSSGGGSTIAAAIADPARPEADVKRDADRKPAEMLAFAGVRPGMKVADFLPGGGYFTRIFAKAVGPSGKVYAVINPPAPNAQQPPPIIAVAQGYPNVQVTPVPFANLALPEPVDVFWTSQNYHDLYLTRFNLDVPSVDKAIFNAIKPGGVLIILDHAANAGAEVGPTANTLHRIDPAVVRRNLEAAGFRYEGESRALANPADDHTKGVFDPSLRGHTDQFIYKFRKPR